MGFLLKNKAFLLSALSLLLVFMLLLTVTFAWFSMNKNTNASGGSVSIQTQGSLSISNSTTFTGLTSVTVPSVSRPILPASHSDSSPTKLIRLSDSVAVDKDTGLSNTPLDPEAFVDVEEEVESKYYIEHIVYIASEGNSFNNSDLIARLESVVPDDITSHQAASVDFFVDDVYRATLNLAGLALSNDTSYTQDEQTTATLVVDGTIPSYQNTVGSRYLKITMRFYFDGALLNSNTTTFVTTNNLDTSEFNLRVLFSVSAH